MFFVYLCIYTDVKSLWFENNLLVIFKFLLLKFLQDSSAKTGTIYYLWMSLKTAGSVANDVDHNQTLRCAAFYVDLHCLLSPNFPEF